jgi:hypothetical protein
MKTMKTPPQMTWSSLRPLLSSVPKRPLYRQLQPVVVV